MAHTGGEWLDLAERVEKVSAELSGTPLAEWRVSLGYLTADCQREAGRMGEIEVEAWQDGHFEDRRAA